MSNPITDVHIHFSHLDGNAFGILGTVAKAMRQNKIEKLVIDDFIQDATSGDYDYLVATVLKYVHLDY